VGTPIAIGGQLFKKPSQKCGGFFYAPTPNAKRQISSNTEKLNYQNPLSVVGFGNLMLVY
jgi:hypothetical protein